MVALSLRRVFQAVFVVAMLINFADFAMTWVGFSRALVWHEMNPHILFFMRWLGPHAAALVVFSITAILLGLGYYLVRGTLNSPPYNKGMRALGRYLWTAPVRGRDIAVFALLALAVYFAYAHWLGVQTWLEILPQVGA